MFCWCWSPCGRDGECRAVHQYQYRAVHQYQYRAVHQYQCRAMHQYRVVQYDQLQVSSCFSSLFYCEAPELFCGLRHFTLYHQDYFSNQDTE